MFNKHDITRNACMLTGGLTKCGYDWWWHSFTARHTVTGEEKPFFIEFFLCNPAYGKETPVFGQLPENKKKNIKPSYLMVKVGTWGIDATQLHHFGGWKNIDVGMTIPYHVSAGDCYIDETKTYGTVKLSAEDATTHPEYMCGSGENVMSLIFLSFGHLPVPNLIAGKLKHKSFGM